MTSCPESGGTAVAGVEWKWLMDCVLTKSDWSNLISHLFVISSLSGCYIRRFAAGIKLGHSLDIRFHLFAKVFWFENFHIGAVA